jgi:UDP-3-O-[3-hydroxymyristoyl] N-acetylglucosamine deacetylase
MDGLFSGFSLEPNASQEGSVPQRSLKTPIGCVGPGGGRRVTLTLCPARPDHGIVFRRTDLGVDIPACPELAGDARQPVVLTRQGVSVVGVEHVLAALSGRGITNAVVELNGAEVPMLNDAVSDFMFLIECAGSIGQDPPAAMTEALRAASTT